MKATITATDVSLSGHIEVASKEDAVALATQFPKSTKVRGIQSSERGAVSFHAELAKNGVNGGVNESGLARFKTFVKTLDKLGIEIDYTRPFGNSLTDEEFSSLLEGLR